MKDIKEGKQSHW